MINKYWVHSLPKSKATSWIIIEHRTKKLWSDLGFEMCMCYKSKNMNLLLKSSKEDHLIKIKVWSDQNIVKALKNIINVVWKMQQVILSIYKIWKWYNQ